MGALPPLTLGVGDAAAVVDAAAAFRDPDGDALTYRAASSAPGVAAATVSGMAVRVRAAAPGTATVTVSATDGGGLSATQAFGVTVNPSNGAPVPVGALPPLTLSVGDAAALVEVAGAFRDPDGDALTYGASSSAPSVAGVSVSGSVVTVTPASEGTAQLTVTATDAGGSNRAATQSFAVTVGAAGPFTDHPIVAGVTPVRAVHFTELRERTDALRVAWGLAPFAWTDRVLTAGVTPMRLAHLLELRRALEATYRGGGAAGAPLDRPGAGGRCDSDPGRARDGAARRGGGARVNRSCGRRPSDRGGGDDAMLVNRHSTSHPLRSMFYGADSGPSRRTSSDGNHRLRPVAGPPM